MTSGPGPRALRRAAATAAAALGLGLAGCGGGEPAREGRRPLPPPPAPPPGVPVVAAAGDIAGPGPDDEATAAVVERMAPSRVLTTGDNVYPSGSLAEFRRFYAPSWGRFRAITRPVPGNHDYGTPGAAGYFGYFGRAAGPRGRGYYGFDLGSWHLVALNSEIALGEGSAQLRWLERDLAASRARCTLAYWHRPRFSSGRYGDDPGLRPAWRVLYRAGADVVLTGHDHGYQRFRALDPEGRPDPRRGIRQWVVGTGGRSHHPLRPDARRLAGDDSAFGVLRLALRRGRFDFAFLPAAGGEYRDAGRGVRCH